jgi:hypothetical protein
MEVGSRGPLPAIRTEEGVTRDDYKRKWRHKLAGAMLYGYFSEERLGPMERARKAWDIPEEVERILDKLYDDAQPAQVNGAIAGRPKV